MMKQQRMKCELAELKGKKIHKNEYKIGLTEYTVPKSQ